VISSIKQTTFGKNIYLSLSVPTAFVIAVRRPSIVAPYAHGGESKNRKAPVLNMTIVGKCRRKKLPAKIRILGPSGFWDAAYGGPTLSTLCH
jgi:hypothetical protein